MVRRMLDAHASDFARMTGRELLESIRAAEGRTLVTETIAPSPPLLGDVTNAELACAFGADMVLLNMFDVCHPRIEGVSPKATEKDEYFFLRTYHNAAAYGKAEGDAETIRRLKQLIGRPVAINLEPVDPDERVLGPQARLPEGRLGTPENALRAKEQGVDMLVLTGNPATGVTNAAIGRALRAIRRAVGNDMVLAAGKMHAAGSAGEAGREIVDAAIVAEWIDAGADIVLLPAPGTVPGVSVEQVRDLVGVAHNKGALAMTAIGTSQEGADEATIRQIALWAKSCGADLHHIGDSGYPGIAVPENILAYSIVIRGRRHAWRRMAASLAR